MYEHINEQLSQCQQNVFRLQKIEAALARANENFHKTTETLQSAQIKLEKEQKDYDRITKRSISSILSSILGNIEEKTEKERREALEAELKLNQCLQDLDDIREEISFLTAKKAKYEYAPAEYDTLYNEKYRLLMNDNSATAQKIMELNKLIELSKRNLREIDEAMKVGHEVEEALAGAFNSLDSAGDWGVWDILGGGLIANVAKHSHIDEAGAAAQRAHSLLNRFHSELADVQISERIQIDISGFSKFADFFFDGLIADWVMQGKINAAKESVVNVQLNVQSVMKELSELQYAEAKAQDSLTGEINMLIIEA